MSDRVRPYLVYFLYVLIELDDRYLTYFLCLKVRINKARFKLSYLKISLIAKLYTYNQDFQYFSSLPVIHYRYLQAVLFIKI